MFCWYCDTREDDIKIMTSLFSYRVMSVRGNGNSPFSSQNVMAHSWERWNLTKSELIWTEGAQTKGCEMTIHNGSWGSWYSEVNEGASVRRLLRGFGCEDEDNADKHVPVEASLLLAHLSQSTFIINAQLKHLQSAQQVEWLIIIITTASHQPNPFFGPLEMNKFRHKRITQTKVLFAALPHFNIK